MARPPPPPPPWSSSSSARFVDGALRTTGPLALSYTHHRLKWIIREHLLSLIEEFPSLKPSSDLFTHDDGTTVRLLNASGTLPLPLIPSRPPAAVDLTIWLHQSYPFVPPIVYLCSASGHPFADSSGAAAIPYLQTWQYPHSNLLDLARNFVNVFTLCPPFFALTHPPTPPPRDVALVGSMASRREAIDRLYVSLSTNVAGFGAQVAEDVWSLMSIQNKLRERDRALDRAMDELQREKEGLRRVVSDTEEWADVARNWLWANNAAPPARDELGPEEMFEVEGNGRSGWWLLDNEAASRAIDDGVWALDEALRHGAVPLDAYLKQVRALSREQFFHMTGHGEETATDIWTQLSSPCARN